VIGVVVIATEEIKMNSLILGGQQHIERNKRNNLMSFGHKSYIIITTCWTSLLH
jgi:hypothetical protein